MEGARVSERDEPSGTNREDDSEQRDSANDIPPHTDDDHAAQESATESGGDIPWGSEDE
jgi:hypothetical protein